MRKLSILLFFALMTLMPVKAAPAVQVQESPFFREDTLTLPKKIYLLCPRSISSLKEQYYQMTLTDFTSQII